MSGAVPSLGSLVTTCSPITSFFFSLDRASILLLQPGTCSVMNPQKVRFLSVLGHVRHGSALPQIPVSQGAYTVLSRWLKTLHEWRATHRFPCAPWDGAVQM